jgi:hypothetical protein
MSHAAYMHPVVEIAVQCLWRSGIEQAGGGWADSVVVAVAHGYALAVLLTVPALVTILGSSELKHCVDTCSQFVSSTCAIRACPVWCRGMSCLMNASLTECTEYLCGSVLCSPNALCVHVPVCVPGTEQGRCFWFCSLWSMLTACNSSTAVQEALQQLQVTCWGGWRQTQQRWRNVHTGSTAMDLTFIFVV